MTFEEWTKSLGYGLTKNEMYRMRQAWEARQPDIDALEEELTGMYEDLAGEDI